MCLKSPHRLRSTWGPFSRYFSGSHVCQTCDGSTTWSSTLMIFGSSSIGYVRYSGFDVGVSFDVERQSGSRIWEVDVAPKTPALSLMTAIETPWATSWA